MIRPPFRYFDNTPPEKQSACIWMLIRRWGKDAFLSWIREVMLIRPLSSRFGGLHCTLHAWFIKRPATVDDANSGPVSRKPSSALWTLWSLSSSLAPHLRSQAPAISCPDIINLHHRASWPRIWIRTRTAFPGAVNIVFTADGVTG